MVSNNEKNADDSSAQSKSEVAETSTISPTTPKTEKKPKPEEKPFKNFICEDLIPSIKKSFDQQGIKIKSIDLKKGNRPVLGDSCSMIIGEIVPGRKFWICFSEENITSQKTISLAESGCEPCTIESFLIDEKKMSLTLIKSRLLQRLNGQKWLGSN